jgi:propionyl-CoA carboxylase alpha chain
VLDVRMLARSTERQVVEVDGVRHAVDVAFHDDGAVSRSHAGTLTWVRPPRFADHEDELAGSGPVCPLPGTVIAVHVAPGASVGDGTVLMVIEAMKMEHTITAHADAVVTEVRFAVGDRVDAGDLLVVLEAPPE